MEVRSVTTVLFLLVVIGNAEIPVCSIHLKDLSERPPLLLRPGGPLSVSSFAAPDADHVLRLEANATFTLACPGASNQLLFANRTTGLRQVNATCARGSVVAVRGQGGAEVDLRTVACARQAERSAEKEGRRRCGADARGQRVRIGFRLLTGFLELVAACFDDRLLSPIYSNYTLVQSRAGAWSESKAVDFRAGRFFGSVDPAHQYESQRLVLQEHAQYLQADSLESASLTPDAGSVFTPSVHTEFFVNAAPQWRSVNAGAWAAVERAARDLAAARGDLLVVTGVYGVSSLPDAQGTSVPLFLYTSGQRKMPVPALFWKVVYDPRSQEGAAVVSNNNPWAPLARHPELRLCADVCARLRWLHLRSNEVYCCEVDALRLRVGDIPALDVQGLLDGPGLQTEPPTTEASTTEPSTTESSTIESSTTEASSTEPSTTKTNSTLHSVLLSTEPSHSNNSAEGLSQNPLSSSRSTVVDSCSFLVLCTISVHLTSQIMAKYYN